MAGIKQRFDLLAGQLFFLLGKIDRRQLFQYAGRGVEQPDKGPENALEHQDSPGRSPRVLLGYLQRQLFWIKLAQHQRDIADQEGNQQGGRRLSALAHPEDGRHDPHEGLRGGGGVKEAAEGDAHLDSGNKAVRILQQLLNTPRFLIAGVSHLFYFSRIQGYKGHFGPRQEGVEKGEQQNCQDRDE